MIRRDHIVQNLKPEALSGFKKPFDPVFPVPREFEQEFVGDGQKAIEQIRDKGYHHQYVQAGRRVMLVGMDFSREKRNLVGFDYEPAGGEA